jgi:hypothetical protein
MKVILFFALALLFHCTASAAPACKGANKNDPGCPGAEEPPVAPAAAAVVDSVTVDWLNLTLLVRGSGFTGSTEFRLGGSLTPLTMANVTDSQVELPFDAVLAAEAATQGNYNLLVDGAVALSVYVEAPILDPAAAGCPCGTDWASELGGLWGPPLETDCFELEGPGANDAADIAGTILTNPLDSTVYPWYPIGASFYPGVPTDSYCALEQIDGDATVTELVRFPINENQQADCAALLEANVCATVNPIP